jgi:hypothetical protein
MKRHKTKRRRRNPIEALDAAEDLLAQLSRNAANHSLFKLEEVRNFVDYCMAALQACPEASRVYVLAHWALFAERPAGPRYNSQLIELEEGKIFPSTRTSEGVYDAVGFARVELDTLHGEWFSNQFSDSLAKEALLTFVQGLHDNYFAAHFGAGSTRNMGAAVEDAHLNQLVSFVSPDAVKAFCDKETYDFVRFAPRRVLFRWHDKPTYATEWGISQGDLPTGVVTVQANFLGASITAISINLITRYAKLVEKLCTMADDLESAGWVPEPESHASRGKLCEWLYGSPEDHPGMWRSK